MDFQHSYKMSKLRELEEEMSQLDEKLNLQMKEEMEIMLDGVFKELHTYIDNK